MAYYVSDKAIEELNRDKVTLIFDGDGKRVRGCVRIRDGKPCIYDMFGCSETIYLDGLRLSDNHLRGEITTHDHTQYIAFRILDKSETLQTEWEA